MIDDKVHRYQISTMILLTLPDGTRTQMAAADIDDVQAADGGSVVRLRSGEEIQVLQSAHLIEMRLRAVRAESE